MKILPVIHKISNQLEERSTDDGDVTSGTRVRCLADVRDGPGLVRRMVTRTTEWFVRRRLERDKSRMALANIDENDLSEFGRQVRRDVLRERRDLELRKRGDRRPVLPPPVSDGIRALGSLGYCIMKIFRTLATWQLRARMRAELLALDDRTLNGIGLTRADVLMESDHPLWKSVDSEDWRAR